MRIVSVAGACSRSGKTALAVSLLRALGPGAAAAAKFTTTEDVFERCPRGAPCVVCDIDVPFRLVEDPSVLDEPGTDTQRLGEAGAAAVVWAIAKEPAAAAAWKAVQARLAQHPLVVMEGSTIVNIARPDLRAFVVHPFLSPERWKPGSPELMAGSDVVVVNRPRSETRPPSAAVMRAIESARPQGQVVVADVTRPPAEWSVMLSVRLRGLERMTLTGARA